jgi:hypothetical protein
MNATRILLIASALTLAAAPIALAHHNSPFSTWMQLHVDSDWTSLTHAQEDAVGGRFMTNLLCLGDSQSSRANVGDLTAFSVDTVGPHLPMGPATSTFKLVNTGAAPECPTLGAGVITFALTGRYEDHTPGNAVTVFGTYTITGTGAYATVTGGGEYSMSFTGFTDADSGWPILLDGAFVGGTHY